MIAAVALAISVAAAALVWRDAATRDWSGRSYGQVEWTIAVALLLIVALPIYLLRRPAAGKRCPDCAERVQLEANVCRFCGHHFGANT